MDRVTFLLSLHRIGVPVIDTCLEDHEVRTDLCQWVGLALRDQLEFDYRRVPFC